MLIGGSLAMLLLAGVGGMLVDYGWREAQETEIRYALKAGVSASAHLLRGDIEASEEDIKERVAGVMRGLLAESQVSADNISIEHDPESGRTTVREGGSHLFRSLWRGGGGLIEEISESVTVEFDASQYEFALALDVSRSMGNRPVGWTGTKLDALKDAIMAIARTVEEASRTNPGTAALSLVPFSNAVNVADTSGPNRTPAKERYVRMLTGADYHTEAAREGSGHWVDTFHHYGTGADMGPLASRDLPDFLAASDWNLRRAETADISAQAPGARTWNTRGEDFWNGCVMARWGAYWHPEVRPALWNPQDSDNWPAAETVAGWEPGSQGVRRLPLHLSDAPPDADNPNTRFTAYSWPDARIAGTADHQLAEVMRAALRASHMPPDLYGTGENHWNIVGDGGDLLCPQAPIVPLTDDPEALAAATHYEPVGTQSATVWGQTFLHLGIVWGLRTLSPLWRDVWSVRSAGTGDILPRIPCSDEGSFEGCSALSRKAIVIVSDGDNYFGPPARGRSSGSYGPNTVASFNPYFVYGRCGVIFGSDVAFQQVMSVDNPENFAAHFDIDASGVFTPAGIAAVAEGFRRTHPIWRHFDPDIYGDLVNARVEGWGIALAGISPWDLFRGGAANDILSDQAFGLGGRPTGNGHFCRPQTPFSAYGKAGDLVRTGDGPIRNAAPFSVSDWVPALPTDDLQVPIEERLDEWFLEACAIAGQRGVEIHAIYLGGDSRPADRRAIALMEACVDRGHEGNPNVEETHVAPTAERLQSAIESAMDIRRILRFVED